MMMKSKSLSILLALMGLAGLAVGQTAATATSPASAIRILSPNAGEKLTQSAVTVQFQLENPGLASGGFPNFSLQLDSRDPVVTAQTSQNFTGLAPGSHTVVVQLLDANGTPISGTRTELQFSVAAPAAPPQPGRPPSSVSADLPQNDAVLTDQGETLPGASSALPLLSVIGFGALVGGVISALRTR
jgi:hypothetical protein